MHVAIDVEDLRRPMSGIGRYVAGLVAGLSELRDVERVGLYHNEELAINPLPQDDSRFALHRATARSETWWGQVTLPLAARRDGMQLIHCPAVRAPAVHRLPLVLTVHDVIFAIHPEYYVPYARRYMHVMLRAVLPRCDQVVVVSSATKRDLLHHFDFPESRTTVAYPGVATRFQPRDPHEARRALHAAGIFLPESYVLFVGTLEPRKNIEVLLAAFASARTAGLPHALVMVGGRGWNDDSIVAAIAKSAQRFPVIHLGHVDDALLPSLYNAASLAAYPSRYEGFGSPVAEAMASGVPLITSTARALVEVTGEAALHIDPDDVEGLAAAMTRLAGDARTSEVLRERGLQRAATFTWRENARHTVTAYRAAFEADALRRSP